MMRRTTTIIVTLIIVFILLCICIIIKLKLNHELQQFVLFKYNINIKRDVFTQMYLFSKTQQTRMYPGRQQTGQSLRQIKLRVYWFYCTPASPHWLAVPFRTTFEVLIQVFFFFLCLNGKAAPYLSEPPTVPHSIQSFKVNKPIALGNSQIQAQRLQRLFSDRPQSEELASSSCQKRPLIILTNIADNQFLYGVFQSWLSNKSWKGRVVHIYWLQLIWYSLVLLELTRMFGELDDFVCKYDAANNNLWKNIYFSGALVHSCGMSSSIETQMKRSFPLTRGEKKSTVT